jgi:hypothetical protein
MNMEVDLGMGEDACERTANGERGTGNGGRRTNADECRAANETGEPRSAQERPMSDDADDLDEVRRRVEEIQRRKRTRIRWRIGQHTAELAIVAIEKPAKSRRNGKSRRRKRNKRLL